MASSAENKDPAAGLAERIVLLGRAAFDPAAAGRKEHDVTQFRTLIESAGTWSLLRVLNVLIRPDKTPPWLRVELLRILTLLPLRKDGVRATLEFVFSVHPSGSRSTAEAATPQKQGGSITTEALKMATKILSAPPAEMDPYQWYNSIAPQLWTLLDGNDGPELTRVASQVISFGILGRRQYGAPGAPGWMVFIHPLLQQIKPSIASDGLPVEDDGDAIIDLTQDRVLVSAENVGLALKRLTALLTGSPSPGLSKRVLDPILLELWALSSWANPELKTEEKYCAFSKTLLKTYLKIAATKDKLISLADNILFRGDTKDGVAVWQFKLTADKNIEIVASGTPSVERDPTQLPWVEIETKAAMLSSVIIETCSTNEVSSFFLELFARWLSSRQQANMQNILVEETNTTSNNSNGYLTDVALLLKLLENSPEKIVSHADQVVELICRVLDGNQVQSHDADVLALTMSLLNGVLTSPGFQTATLGSGRAKNIERALDTVARQGSEDLAQTARNLKLLLHYHDELEQNEEERPIITNQQIEDRSTYKLALSYITDTDAPPPVRSEGLSLISRLILSNSSALDIPSVVVLLSSILADNEDFVNLRVIKMFTQLANKHPKTVCTELLDHYLDPRELASTDTRLKFGEALVQVIERLGATFAGDAATQISETLLSIASRRGYRPKTEARQAREERVRQKKNREADDAWGGEVLDLSEDIPEEERKNNEILSQIVQGWESKRGSEDVRMRASALSILATAMETNIAGVGPTLVSTAVDLCINILAYEAEPEKAILRRAAIIIILSFTNALDKARENGQNLGFGLTDTSREDILRTLQYIEATDNDGLVQQHARDVIESLENWQLRGLLSLRPRGDTSGSMLGRLEGLTVGPESINLPPMATSGAVVRNKPKIEEID